MTESRPQLSDNRCIDRKMKVHLLNIFNSIVFPFHSVVLPRYVCDIPDPSSMNTCTIQDLPQLYSQSSIKQILFVSTHVRHVKTDFLRFSPSQLHRKSPFLNGPVEHLSASLGRVMKSG
jgi:hypothetical protein